MKRNKDKDWELIAKIKEGDTALFRILVDKYKDVSFSLAYSILKNEQDAEDALQDSFIKAFKGLETFNFKSSFATWLYKIVFNTCNTKYKSDRQMHELVNLDSDSNIEIEESLSPFSEIEQKERIEAVNKVLDMINENESFLLRLFYLAELSISEIVQVTGFKESKIKVTLHRARKSFLQKLETEYRYPKTPLL